MFQQLLPLMPQQAGPAVVATLLSGALAGIVLWLAGARYSRMVMTLISVALGAATSFVGAYINYFLDGATGGVLRCCPIIATLSSPTNGGRPQTIS